jgi:hypothetical protein
MRIRILITFYADPDADFFMQIRILIFIWCGSGCGFFFYADADPDPEHCLAVPFFIVSLAVLWIRIDPH